MKKLLIYPSSRALRKISETFRSSETLLPTLMRMDEFEKRAVLVKGKTEIDPLSRILFLREASQFEAFDTLRVDRDLIRFFTKSDALFRFFEEMSAEHVDFATLREADAYAEFGRHLDILETLRNNYKKLTEEHGFTDKTFVPESYVLNIPFIKSYARIEIRLEGYLSRFELELLEKISRYTELIIHYTTSRFNRKMQERFAMYGIVLHEEKHDGQPQSHHHQMFGDEFVRRIGIDGVRRAELHHNAKPQQSEDKDQQLIIDMFDYVFGAGR